MDARKTVITALTVIAAMAHLGAQVTSDVKDVQVAKKQLRIGIDTSKYFTSPSESITSGATHRQMPTAKAVYDYGQTLVTGGVSDGDKGDITVSGSGATWNIDANAVGATEIAAGAVGSSELAQQGATQGQVLRWSGTAWVPNGTNLYDIATTSGNIAAHLNQVWVATLTASITLNLPACNAGNDGLKFEISKSGSDNFGVVIEPAGSETFIDGATSKTLYSRGTSLSCTCRFRLGDGQWYFIH